MSGPRNFIEELEARQGQLVYDLRLLVGAHRVRVRNTELELSQAQMAADEHSRSENVVPANCPDAAAELALIKQFALDRAMHTENVHRAMGRLVEERQSLEYWETRLNHVSWGILSSQIPGSDTQSVAN